MSSYKKILTSLFISGIILSACGPNAPAPSAPDGTTLEGDSRAVGGKVSGLKLSDKTKVALFGAFKNISGNKINAKNETVENDVVLAVAPLTDGKYEFSLPKSPPKANTAASFDLFAFNDENGNGTYDEGELKSKAASIRWVVGIGYQSAKDADGNEVLISEFKDFDFTLE